MKARKSLSLLALAVLVPALGACSPTEAITVEAPVIFWNRQPTDANNNVDLTVMNDERFEHIYYVGFDAIQGGQLQGEMVVDYLEAQATANTAWWQQASADGVLEYGLLIGQVDHNDSAARTAGTRDALHTRMANPTTNANSEQPVEGKLTINGTEYTVVEKYHQEARATGGATWDAGTAQTIVTGWMSDAPDFIVSNNDGMAEAAKAAVDQTGTQSMIPIFGYDSNASTLEFIDEGGTTGGVIVGTVNQNASAQVAGILMLARNLIEGVTNPTTSGFNGNAGNHGTIPASSAFNYNAEDHSLLVDNFAITAENVDDYVGVAPADLAFDSVTAHAGDENLQVFLDVYSSTDTFLNSSILPLFNAYRDEFSFTYDQVAGDGSSDATVIDRIINKRAAYLVNPVRTTAAQSYLDTIYNVEAA